MSLRATDIVVLDTYTLIRWVRQEIADDLQTTLDQFARIASELSE